MRNANYFDNFRTPKYSGHFLDDIFGITLDLGLDGTLEMTDHYTTTQNGQIVKFTQP